MRRLASAARIGHRGLGDGGRGQRRTAAPGPVLLKTKTQSHGCKLGANPDRRCSPGAYYSKLTKDAICDPNFHTSAIRYVPDADKRDVPAEYGLGPQSYWPDIEIDHIVSLELGGSNDPANLYPEGVGADPAGYHIKDKLENKLHDLVCDGEIGLRTAQRWIASDWQALYKDVYGVAPTN